MNNDVELKETFKVIVRYDKQQGAQDFYCAEIFTQVSKLKRILINISSSAKIQQYHNLHLKHIPRILLQYKQLSRWNYRWELLVWFCNNLCSDQIALIWKIEKGSKKF